MSDVTGWFRRGSVVLLLTVALIGLGPAVHAADPVKVTVAVTGSAVPLGTVTATATVQVNDGSTIQSYAWTQESGAQAAISGATTATATVMLAAESTYKAHLIHVLSEPPIGPEQLPPNVPPPEGEFHGGLQDRFQVVAASPFALEEGALVVLEVAVKTSSGTHYGEAEIHTAVPWRVSPGLHTVPVGAPVLLHGKSQASYDWKLTPPTGSGITLKDAATQNPEFTPAVAGLYKVEVTDLTAAGKASPLLLRIYAGPWRGVIVDQDANHRPVADPACLECHDGGVAPDAFSEWQETGHAEIFSNMLDTNTHYGPNCFACHTVGYDPGAANGGFDDADDYQAFLDSGLINHPGDNWTTALDQFPHAAQLANIQCENCHGPQGAASHSNGGPRISLSSDLCGVCHGEPARHGRFQQWQLSAHANYELAVEEGTSSSCARCHSANGFIQWVEELAADPDAEVEVTWTEDEVHPQTCQACHDPHDIGTTSGSDATNATVRIMGDSPELTAGFTATDVGKGAVCITCHNSRRGLRNDATFLRSDSTRAPHPGTQADVLMGENVYFVEVGQRAYHADVEDACVACHMDSTPPPPDLSYNLGGTNHTFYASPEICSDCHSVLTAEEVQGPVEAGMEELQELVEQGIFNLIEGQLALNRTIDLGGQATITRISDVLSIEFTETRGRQAITVTFKGGSVVGPTALNSVRSKSTGGGNILLYDLAADSLPKAGWNLLLLHSDGSHGVHNPGLVEAVLEASKNALIATPPSSGGIGGGAAEGEEGAGAVACVSSHVYWTEIAAHNRGVDGSTWRTDLIARNTVGAPADLEFYLHTDGGDIKKDGAVASAAQGVFEDIVGSMGFEGKGALEICSDQPLEVMARIFNQSDGGTFGQFLDGYAGGSGMSAGHSARLLGLRQLTGAYRTNIGVTNTGLTTAKVRITLFGNDGREVHSYQLTVGSGRVVQDLQPFAHRAGRPDIGWGFALVEVVEGSGVLTSASVIDAVTNDATTVLPKS